MTGSPTDDAPPPHPETLEATTVEHPDLDHPTVEAATLADEALDAETRVQVGPPASRPAQLGPFPITGKLGMGGMGAVLEVHDPALGRRVAAKVIRGDENAHLRSRFAREAQLNGQLEHPGIVPVYQLGNDADGRMYFTMKKVQGRTLKELVTEVRGSGKARIDLSLLQIFLKICDAIGYAHSRGVIHRDLKPANVMVGEFGEVQVMDWGLAKRVAIDGAGSTWPAGVPTQSDADAQLTLAGTRIGTPNYMAPEQARGDMDAVDARSDVYALGGLLYELLTLEMPFRGATASDVIDQVQQGALIAPRRRAPTRQIPWELEAVVLQAMATEPDARYPTAAALSADIARYLDGRLISAARYGPLTRLRKWAGRHPTSLLALLVAFTVGIGFVGWRASMLRREREQRQRSAADAIEQGRLGEAEALFRQQLTVNPSDPDARGGLELIAIARRTTATRTALERTEALLTPCQDAVVLARERTEVLASAWTGGRDAPAPDPDADAVRQRALRAHLQAAAALDVARRLAADDPQLIRRHREVHESLVWIALAGGDYTLAAHHAAELARAGASADRVRGWRERVDGLQQARQRFRSGRLAAILKRLVARDPRTAPVDAADRAELADEVVGFREPPTVAAIARALDPLVARASRQLSVGRRLPWRTPERTLIAFACNVLPRLQLAESVAPLARLASVADDAWTATRVGQALCKTRQPAAVAPLLTLSARFSPTSRTWQEIARFSDRLPDPPDTLGSTLGATTWQLAVLRLGQGRLADADALLTRLITASGQDARAHRERAIVRMRRDLLEAALEDAERAVALDSPAASSWYVRAQVQLRAGRVAAALADVDQALTRDPGLAEARIVRGLALQRSERHADAIADFDAAIAMQPDQAAAWFGRGQSSLSLGQLQTALADLTRCLALEPDHVPALIARAQGYRRLGRRAAALRDADRAVEVAPGNGEAWLSQALMQTDLKRHEAAWRGTERALALGLEHAQLRALRARVLAERGQLEQALDESNKAVALAPRDVTVLRQRAQIHVHRRQPRPALADCDRVLALAPHDWQTLTMAGRLHGVLRNTTRARSLLSRALKHAPLANRPKLEALLKALGAAGPGDGG